MQYRALEKWNGRLPVMNGGGALPMLSTFDFRASSPRTTTPR